MSRRSNVAGTSLALMSGIACAILLGEATSRAYFLFASRGVASSAGIVQQGELFEYDEVLGYHMIPGAHVRFAGPEFDVRFSINQAGLRQASDVSPGRPAGRRRILLLGDSFVFGHGVMDRDRFGDRLATILPDSEVVNMGMSGTGTDQQLLFYQRDGIKYKADLVLLGYMTENIRRNAMKARLQNDGRMIPKPKFELRGASLVLTNVPVPHSTLEDGREELVWRERYSLGIPIPFKRHLSEHSALYQLAGSRFIPGVRRLLRSSVKSYEEYDESRQEWRLTAALLTEFARVVNENGSRFAVVVIPPVEYVYDPGIGERPHRMLGALARDRGFMEIDLLPRLKQAASAGDCLYFRMDTHWTPQGHAVAAQAVAAAVAGLFPGPRRSM